MIKMKMKDFARVFLRIKILIVSTKREVAVPKLKQFFSCDWANYNETTTVLGQKNVRFFAPKKTYTKK